MVFETHVIFSLTAGAGALIGWIRIKKTDPAYLPFILLLTAGFVTELVSLIVMENGYSNAVYYNLFALAEALLVTQLFYRLGLFKNKKRYVALQVFYVVLWLCECVYHLSTTSFNTYFIVIYSTVLVFLAIDLLHELLFQMPHKLYRNPVFLICMGMIVYFTYTIIVELFWFYGLNQSSTFRIRIYEVFSYINLFTNILFILATLWIPLKREYILHSL
ncbi:hypothetical protein WG954_03775 [Lacibacter sp. H375]|uniref:hypothetical protein n=1 Tax=Lacibacter sp. H375 TaxID=3133424 RepID=UPI0030C3B24B